jgi:hypothetical protein
MIIMRISEDEALSLYSFLASFKNNFEKDNKLDKDLLNIFNKVGRYIKLNIDL